MTCGKNKGRGSMLKHKEGMDSIPNIHDADQSNVRQRIRLQTTSLDCQEKELNNRLDSYDEHEFQWVRKEGLETKQLLQATSMDWKKK